MRRSLVSMISVWAATSSRVLGLNFSTHGAFAFDVSSLSLEPDVEAMFSIWIRPCMSCFSVAILHEGSGELLAPPAQTQFKKWMPALTLPWPSGSSTSSL